MMSKPLNTTRTECTVEAPVLSLIGEQNGISMNMVINIALMFTATLGNISILLSFALVSSLRWTSNYLLFGLALTDLGVGLPANVLSKLLSFLLSANKMAF